MVEGSGDSRIMCMFLDVRNYMYVSLARTTPEMSCSVPYHGLEHSSYVPDLLFGHRDQQVVSTPPHRPSFFFLFLFSLSKVPTVVS